MPREALLGELRNLGRRELELTLGFFQPAEREHVRRLIGDARAGHGATVPSFDTLVGLSPWLLKAIDRSKSLEPAMSRMTPATRAALAGALGKVAHPRKSEQPSEPGILSVLSRMLGARRPRGQAA